MIGVRFIQDFDNRNDHFIEFQCFRVDSTTIFSHQCEGPKTHVYRWKSKNNSPGLLCIAQEPIDRCVWLRMNRMEMDSSLKTSGISSV